MDQLFPAMDVDNSNVRAGGAIRSDTSETSSGSNELPAKLVAEAAAMDYEMRVLENKIRNKKEEEERLLETKISQLSSVASLKKQFVVLQDRERSFITTLNRAKDNSTVLEELEMAVIQNLKAIQLSSEEQKFRCNEIIEKYSGIINSHQESFAVLPWAEKNKLLSVEVMKKQIILAKLKMRQQESCHKLRLLGRISENRLRIEILRLSKLMIEREATLRDASEERAKRQLLEEEIRSLERDKARIQEQIASKTQEMIRRIMNRSSDKPQEPPKPTVTQTRISIPHEMKHTEPSVNLPPIKDRINIVKKQEYNIAVLSIRDRLGINKKQLNVSLAAPTTNQAPTDEVTASNCQIAERPHDDASKPFVEESSSPIISQHNSADGLEYDSNKKADLPNQVDQNNETPSEMPAITADPPDSSVEIQESNRQIADEPVTTTVLQISPPSKAILKPRSSLSNKAPENTCISGSPLVSPTRSGDENISAEDKITTKESASDISKNNQYRAISPDESCKENKEQDKDKELVDISFHKLRDKGLVMDAPAPKKPRITKEMLPRSTPASQKTAIKKSIQRLKTTKKVSFVSNNEDNLEKEPTMGRIDNSQLEPLSTSASMREVFVDVEMKRDGSSKQTEPVDKTIGPDVSVGKEAEHEDAAENRSVSSMGDEFKHLFSPSPQPYSAPQQGIQENFDSIFGAIFNTPGTSKSSAFNFNPQDATQAHAGNEAATTSGNTATAQDFFSFFETPKTKEPKNSFNDNFFKLF